MNDAPTISLNQLSIEQDGSVTLTVGKNLSASDPDNATDQLIYQVSNISGGQFEKVSTPGIAITTFTALDLGAGNITFKHDGGTSAPSYELTVFDGEASSAPSKAKVTFTLAAIDEIFANEAGAAESFVNELANQGSEPRTSTDPDSSTDDEPTDEKAVSYGQAHAAALVEEALSLRDNAPSTAQQEHSILFFSTINQDEERDRNTGRSSAVAETLKSLVSSQLKLAPELAAPVASHIDASLEFMSAVVRSSNFQQSLDLLREDVSDEFHLRQAQIGSSIAVSTGLSIGYVVWLIRGGVLVSSMLSALPAWRFIDPLPILAFGGSDEDEDQESLETIVQSNSHETQSSIESSGETD